MLHLNKKYRSSTNQGPIKDVKTVRFEPAMVRDDDLKTSIAKQGILKPSSQEGVKPSGLRTKIKSLIRRKEPALEEIALTPEALEKAPKKQIIAKLFEFKSKLEMKEKANVFLAGRSRSLESEKKKSEERLTAAEARVEVEKEKNRCLESVLEVAEKKMVAFKEEMTTKAKVAAKKTEMETRELEAAKSKAGDMTRLAQRREEDIRKMAVEHREEVKKIQGEAEMKLREAKDNHQVELCRVRQETQEEVSRDRSSHEQEMLGFQQAKEEEIAKLVVEKAVLKRSLEERDAFIEKLTLEKREQDKRVADLSGRVEEMSRSSGGDVEVPGLEYGRVDWANKDLPELTQENAILTKTVADLGAAVDEQNVTILRQEERIGRRNDEIMNLKAAIEGRDQRISDWVAWAHFYENEVKAHRNQNEVLVKRNQELENEIGGLKDIRGDHVTLRVEEALPQVYLDVQPLGFSPSIKATMNKRLAKLEESGSMASSIRYELTVDNNLAGAANSTEDDGVSGYEDSLTMREDSMVSAGGKEEEVKVKVLWF